MTVLFTLVIGILIIILSKSIFDKWSNHLSLYIFVWMLFLILYEIKLIRFVDLSIEVWVVIVLTIAAFTFGSFTVVAARAALGKSNLLFQKQKDFKISLLSDRGKTLWWTILIISIIGLFAAVQHWMVLIDKFGSIPAVLIKANIIYKMRVEEDIKGTIPYLYIISYVGVFLSGIYTAYKNKLTFIALLSLIAVILKDMASVGRAGMFFGFLEFLITIILFRHFITINKSEKKQNKKNIILALIIITAIAIASSTAVKTFRGNIESFKASSSSLNKLKGGSVITPSIYLYFSSNVGVLSKYFEHGGEGAMFGENTFLPIYNLLSKFEVVRHPNFYPKGYFIPMWTNSATYLREIHADFGYVGLFFVPYILGLLTTFFWYRFFELGSILNFLILIFLNLIISFSVFYMVTRSAIWLLSLIFLFGIIPLIEKIALKNSKKKLFLTQMVPGQV